ncbi:MAG: leucine-rich repeat protein, partial [Bacilli bacterium]|nr:leucine-rich repeat protein [Bacilli bacterium]
QTPDLTNVVSIGDYAFSGCALLTAITFGSDPKIESLGASSFENCSSISKFNSSVVGEMIIPNSVVTIASSAFKNLNLITKVVLPNSVNYLGDFVFSGFSSLSYIELPFVGNSISATGEDAYFGSIFGTSSYTNSYSAIQGSDLTYYIPKGLSKIKIGGQTIAEKALKNLISVTDLTIADSVTSIGEGALNGCSSLVNITAPKVTGYSKIVTSSYDYSGGWNKDEDTFTFSTSTISSSLNTEYITFNSACNLTLKYCLTGKTYTSVNTNIYLFILKNGSTLYSCYSTTLATRYISVSAGDTLTFSFKKNLYSGYESGASVAMTGASSITSSPSFGVVFGKGSYSESYSDFYGNKIPSSLTNITLTSANCVPEYSFSGFSSIKQINLPDSLTSIEGHAFENCVALDSINGNGVVDLPSSLISIGNSSFQGCSNISSLVCYPDLYSIGDYSFSGCSSLGEINISDTVTSIGSGAFAKCSSLTKATIPFESTGTFYEYFGSDDSFEAAIPKIDCNGNTKYVPGGLVSIEINSSTVLGNNAFYNCSQITSIKLNEGIKSIGQNCFYNCSGLTSLVIPDSVTSIDSSLSGCSNLIELKIPFVGQTASDSLDFGYIFGTSSYENSYSAAQSEGTYYIPNSLVAISIGGSTISSGTCKNLTSIKTLIVSNSVQTIDSGAFQYCSSIENITVPFVGN